MFSVTTPRPIVEAVPECVTNEQCTNDKACVNNVCVNVCRDNPCARSATCFAQNHSAVCKCPPGYTGNPTRNCFPSKLLLLLNFGDGTFQCLVEVVYFVAGEKVSGFLYAFWEWMKNVWFFDSSSDRDTSVGMQIRF